MKWVWLLKVWERQVFKFSYFLLWGCCWYPRKVMSVPCSERAARGHLEMWEFGGTPAAEVRALAPPAALLWLPRQCSWTLLQLFTAGPALGDVAKGFTAPGMWHLTRDSLPKVLLVLEEKHPREVEVKARDVGVWVTSVLHPNGCSVSLCCLALLPNVTWVRIRTRFLMVCNHIRSHDAFESV